MKASIANLPIDRRRFNAWLAAGLATGLYPGMAQSQQTKAQTLKVAALQMAPKLGDARANMEQAEQLIRDAQKMGAQWIMLPEMFTTAAAFHPDMLTAIQPVDGAPAQMMRRLARQGNNTIGGSFLASRNGEVYNSFVLVFPDGQIVRHDKDQPTYWENCYYRGGEDDGVLATPVGNIGSVLCWEFIRSRTMRRLRGKIRLVLGGSCWWTLSDDVDADHPFRSANLNMLQQAPVLCARMLGVPVIHASHAGPFNGFFSPDLADLTYDSAYLGETMIVDADGQILARRSARQGAGIVVSDIVIPQQAAPSLEIPEAFWTPPEMPEPWKESWQRWLTSGAYYYDTVTKPYVQTGELKEFIPAYML
jgi:predicted amidohydrolase